LVAFSYEWCGQHKIDEPEGRLAALGQTLYIVVIEIGQRRCNSSPTGGLWRRDIGLHRGRRGSFTPHPGYWQAETAATSAKTTMMILVIGAGPFS